MTYLRTITGGPRSLGRRSGGLRGTPLKNTDYFTSDGATYPIYTNTFPAAFHDQSSNKTWSVWEAWNPSVEHRFIRCRVYDHTVGTWGLIYNVAQQLMISDDHGVPSSCMDHQGYAHAFYGPHNSFMRHSVTTAPNDPSSWTERPTIGDGMTYPHPLLVGSAIYLFMRHTPDGAADNGRHLILYKTAALNNGVEAWGSMIDIADSGATPDYSSNYGTNNRFYQGTTLVRGTDIHFVATISNRFDQFRHNVYYLIYDTVTGAVRNFAGDVTVAAGSLPVDRATLDASFMIVAQPTASLASGTVPVLCFDTADNPHILYSDGTLGSTAFRVWHKAYISSAWTTPYNLGVSNSKDSEYTITPKGSGVAAYWTQAAGMSGDGGDLWTATRLLGGAWGSGALLRAAGANAINEPQMVKDGHANARLIFTEIHQTAADSGAGGLHMWMYGDKGYLRVRL